MKMVIDYPPNIDNIDAILHVKDKDVYYCYGNTIYNPKNFPIPNFILAHEKAHSVRQLAYIGGPEAWWEKYIIDPDFRYNEEVIGHTAEYKIQVFFIKDRNLRHKILYNTARRLTSSIYGYNKNIKEAIKDISR